jgi:hypothetical protein
MIKKFLALIVLSSLFFVSAAAHAQRPSVQYDEATSSPGEQTSGFYDKETGRPLTIDEYNKYREEAAKGVYEKYPIPATLVTVAIIGGSGYAVVRWRKGKKAKKA